MPYNSRVFTFPGLGVPVGLLQHGGKLLLLWSFPGQQAAVRLSQRGRLNVVTLHDSHRCWSISIAHAGTLCGDWGCKVKKNGESKSGWRCEHRCKQLWCVNVGFARHRSQPLVFSVIDLQSTRSRPAEWLSATTMEEARSKQVCLR